MANISMGGGYFLQLVIYYAFSSNLHKKDPVVSKLVDQLFDGTDEWRTDRVKLFPCTVEANWLLKRGIGMISSRAILRNLQLSFRT